MAEIDVQITELENGGHRVSWNENGEHVSYDAPPGVDLMQILDALSKVGPTEIVSVSGERQGRH